MPVLISSQQNGLGPFGYYALPMVDIPGIKASAHYCGPSVDPDSRPKAAGGVRTLGRDQGRETEAAAKAAVDAVISSTSRFVQETFGHVETEPFYTENCLYTSTPDHDYILGRVPNRPGCVLAGGGSGHAFKMGPAIGECAAAIALGEVPPLPTEQLAVERLLSPHGIDERSAGNK